MLYVYHNICTISSGDDDEKMSNWPGWCRNQIIHALVCVYVIRLIMIFQVCMYMSWIFEILDILYRKWNAYAYFRITQYLSVCTPDLYVSFRKAGETNHILKCCFLISIVANISGDSMAFLEKWCENCYLYLTMMMW